MYLKRLEIVGFKSFTERTTVTFGPGISAVVGPNGCGKSNIIDAIRWVMGEQSPKLLRARNMEDLLFNGSQNRPPAAVAEVTLTLARDEDPNRGQAEVSVTRRLYRGGDSEYLINRTSGRLKDVVRFFIEAGMGTRNYSIIEQEKVGRLVDAPPEERRLLIDEAAGVTRYKEQKRESERRLESAGQNLVTVSAMLAETGKRLAVVSRAAAKASRWKALRDELRSLELALSAKLFLTLTSKRAALSAEASARKEEMASREAAAAQAELRIDEARLAETALVQALEDAVSAWHQNQGVFGELKKELELNIRESDESEQILKTAQEELDSLSGQGADQQPVRDEIVQRVEALRKELQDADALRASLAGGLKKAESLWEKAGAERSRLDSETSKTRDLLQRRIESQAGEEGRIKILRENLRKYQLERNQSEELVAEAERTLASKERHKRTLLEDLASADERQEDSREDRARARRALDAAMKELGAADRELAALSSRFDTLENLKDGGFGWYPEGVKALLKDPEVKGLISPVAEALKVPDGFEEAAEAFLGERLGWILAENREAALGAIKHARGQGLGRCGIVSKADLKNGDLLAALLGPVELRDETPETIDPTLSKALLTRQGDYLGPLMMAGGGKELNGEGVKTDSKPDSKSGSKTDSKEASKGSLKGAGKNEIKTPQKEPAKGSQGLLTRLKELEALEMELASAEEAKLAIDAKVRAARGELAAADEALTAAESKKASLTADIADANSKIMVANSEIKGLIIRRDSLAGEMTRAEAQIAESERLLSSAAEGREALSSALAKLETDQREAALAYETRAWELEDVRQKSRAAADQVDQTAERLEGAKRELSRLDAWLANLDKRRDALKRQVDATTIKLRDLTEKRAEAEARMEGLPDEVAEAERKVAELRKTLAASRDDVTAAEEAARAARRAREETATALSEIDAGLMDANFGLNRLKDDLLKDWRVILAGPKDDLYDEPELQNPPSKDSDSLDGAKPGSSDDDSEGDDSSRDEAPGSSDDDPEGDDSGAGHSGSSDDDDESVDSGGDEAHGSSDDDSEGDGSGFQKSASQESSAQIADSQNSSTPIVSSQAAQDASETGDVSQADSKIEEIAPSSAETWEAAQPPPERIDPFDLAEVELADDAEAAIGRLRERLAAMGEINHTALAEEVELTSKMSFHQTQHDDLVEAINDLKDSIERVNQTCQKRFADTFAQADIKFREIFPVLFEGGEGWLTLTDENDPLESGVEIHVHPPGKKIMVMRSLSGGEKTLTSLCLIFALYLIKPSPYCLLDEADAPLDEANIDRFNRLLRNLSENSQIIMVTHNKRTMQISDTLYGVTMETPGVSRLVSVNLSEAEVLTDG